MVRRMLDRCQVCGWRIRPPAWIKLANLPRFCCCATQSCGGCPADGLSGRKMPKGDFSRDIYKGMSIPLYVGYASHCLLHATGRLGFFATPLTERSRASLRFIASLADQICGFTASLSCSSASASVNSELCGSWLTSASASASAGAASALGLAVSVLAGASAAVSTTASAASSAIASSATGAAASTCAAAAGAAAASRA